MNGGANVELTDYIQVITRWKWLIGIGVLLSCIAAFAISLRLPKVYRSSVTLLIAESRIPGPRGELSPVKMTPQTILGIIKNPELATQAVAEFDLAQDRYQLTPESFLANVLKVNSVRGTELINLVVDFPDPTLSAKIANYLAKEAVAENKAFNLSDTVSTQDYIKTQMDATADTLKDVRDKLAQFQSANSVAVIRQKIEIQLAQREILENRYLEVLVHLDELQLSPLKKLLDDAEAQLLEFWASANLANLKGEKDLLVEQKRRAGHAYEDIRIAHQGHQAQAKELKLQLAKQQRVELVTKSIVDEPALLEAASARSEQGGGQTLSLRLTSEEFNPVYRNTMQELVNTHADLASFEARAEYLKARMKIIGVDLADVEGKLAKTEILRDRMVEQHRLARQEWAAQVAQSLPATLVRKKVLETKIAANETELGQLQFQLAETDDRLDELNTNLVLAKDAYTLFATKLEEASLSVASRASDLKIVELALTPRKPIKPNFVLNISMTAVVSLMALLLAAVFLGVRRSVRATANA